MTLAEVNFTPIPGLTYNGLQVGYDAVTAEPATPPPVSGPLPIVVPPAVPAPDVQGFRQHAEFSNGSRTISDIVIIPQEQWVVDFVIPKGQNNILRLVVAEAGGGPGIKHVDIYDVEGNILTSGDAHPGTVTLYLDTANHNYGYPQVAQGSTVYVVLTVPTQNEYTKAFLDIQFAL